MSENRPAIETRDDDGQRYTWVARGDIPIDHNRNTDHVALAELRIERECGDGTHLPAATVVATWRWHGKTTVDVLWYDTESETWSGRDAEGHARSELEGWIEDDHLRVRPVPGWLLEPLPRQP